MIPNPSRGHEMGHRQAPETVLVEPAQSRVDKHELAGIRPVYDDPQSLTARRDGREKTLWTLPPIGPSQCV